MQFLFQVPFMGFSVSMRHLLSLQLLKTLTNPAEMAFKFISCQFSTFEVANKLMSVDIVLWICDVNDIDFKILSD